MRQIPEWIRHSNLIEGVDDLSEDARSYRAWKWWNTQHISQGVITGLLYAEIMEVHRRIMVAKLPMKHRGQPRTCDVWVGGRRGVDPKLVRSALKIWVETFGWSQSEKLIKYAHIEFEKIHPFVDGNGRTGRMLMNWQRVRAGFDPLLIRVEERQAYYQWFH